MLSYQHQREQFYDNHNNDCHYYGPEAYSRHDKFQPWWESVCNDDDDDDDENGCCVSAIISGWPSLTHDTY